MKMRKSYKLKLLKNEFKGDKTYLVTGFQGFGAVGFLAPRYIVSKLTMDFIGYIEPPNIPDFTSIEDYGFSMPHEIFYRHLDNGCSVVVLLNRVNPERRYMFSFINEFLALLKKIQIAEVVLFGGLDARFREGEEEYRWLKTSSSKRELNAPYFIKGAYIVGPLASILISLQQNNIPAVAILPYTQPETIDHKAAAIAVKILSSIISTEIDVSELLSYAEKVEEVEKMIQELYDQQIKKKESVMHT
ncbi:MAG: PAC2 family protein [Ignisphaera sp.]